MSRRFFSSPETGPWKNAFSTECIRNWSPGARVGHAYVKVDCMNGTPDVPTASACGNGTCRGRFGFAVADVGRGGRWRMSGVSPGMSRATTLLIDRVFWRDVSRGEVVLFASGVPRLGPSSEGAHRPQDVKRALVRPG